MRKTVLVLVIVIAALLGIGGAAAVMAVATTPAQVLHGNQAAAVSAADQMLGQVVLPAGATQVQGEPAGDEHQLARSMDLSIYRAEVDRHAFWTTSASPSAVIASFEANFPPGAKSSGEGYSGQPTTIFASYSLPTVNAPALGPRTLTVNAMVLSNGSTGVRADAGVRYTAPRLPAQRIPPRAQVLDVTMVNYGSPPLLSRTVTNRAQVRRIASVVDGLPFVASLRGVAFSCPALMLAPTAARGRQAVAPGRLDPRVEADDPAVTADQLNELASFPRSRILLAGGATGVTCGP